MGWLFSHASEVIDRGDDAAAKEPVPNAVHHHAGGERVLRVGDGIGELLAPTERGVIWLAAEDFEIGARYGLAGLEMIAAGQQRRVVGDGFEHAGRVVQRRYFGFELAILRHERPQGFELGERRRQDIATDERIEEQALRLGELIVAPRIDGIGDDATVGLHELAGGLWHRAVEQRRERGVLFRRDVLAVVEDHLLDAEGRRLLPVRFGLDLSFLSCKGRVRSSRVANSM